MLGAEALHEGDVFGKRYGAERIVFTVFVRGGSADRNAHNVLSGHSLGLPAKMLAAQILGHVLQLITGGIAK